MVSSMWCFGGKPTTDIRAHHSDMRKKWLEVSSGCSKESDVTEATDELAVSAHQEAKNRDSLRGWEDVDQHLRGDGVQARLEAGEVVWWHHRTLKDVSEEHTCLELHIIKGIHAS